MDVLICALQDLTGQDVSFKSLLLEISEIKNSESVDLSSVCTRASIQLRSFAALKEFNDREDVPFVREDFEGVADRAWHVMHAYEALIPLCVQPKPLLRSVSRDALLVCLQHCQPSSVWTSSAALQASQSLISCVTSAFALKDLSSLLTDQEIVQLMFKECRSHLTRKRWKQNPGSVCVFSQCALSVTFPHLSLLLDDVLPPSLLILDDFQTEHKILGIQILSHVMLNCSATELSWQGRSEVMYDALERMTYASEVEVLSRVYPALLLCLRVVEKQPWQRHDSIFQRLLYNMQLENRIPVRLVYAENLPPFIEALGSKVMKHLKKLMPVMFAFLEVHDGPLEKCRLSILSALEVTLKVAWMRIEGHSDEILQCLVKFIYEMSVDSSLTSSEVKSSLIARAVQNLVLLKRLRSDVEEKIVALPYVNEICSQAFSSLLANI